MNYKHLLYFWTVARLGGVVKAGEHLHVTPQTISGQIQLLEEHFGRPLFKKKGRQLALTHHEKWDGTGYPDHLSGLDIPVEARVVAIADVFDALCSVRPYKQAWPVAKAFDYLREHAGSQFDPAVVAAALSRRERIEEVHRYCGTASA